MFLRTLFRTSCPSGWPRERPRGKGEQRKIRIVVEIHEDALTYRTRVTAPSIERALKIVGGGKPDRSVRLVFPSAMDERRAIKTLLRP